MRHLSGAYLRCPRKLIRCAACHLILNIHLLRKTYRFDNSLPNVQYVYISIRRKEEKCSVKPALFCFFNAHNFPDVKGSSFK